MVLARDRRRVASSARAEIREQGAQVVESLGATAPARAVRPSRSRAEVLDEAVAGLRGTYDRRNGGWGGAPKFPQRSAIEFLLARGEREMSLETLRAMARGGIYDQVGGGFARYAVDATWTVPHFEKMLYDNALLARAYLHGWQVSGEERMRAGLLRDARLGAARDAGPRGRLLLGARRRLRGRRGEVLRLDARRAPRALGDAPTRRSPTSRRSGNSSAAVRARGPRPGARPTCRRSAPALRRARGAGPPGPRRQAADRPGTR